MIALIMLSICAYTDLRERNIYLMPLIISASGAAAITLTDLAFAFEKRTLFHWLLIPAAAGILVMLCVRMKRDHIGIGDGYMTAALGMIIGTGRCFLTVTAGLAAASLYAALTAFSKKGLRRRIPFAPFIMAGYMLLLFNGS